MRNNFYMLGNGKARIITNIFRIYNINEENYFKSSYITERKSDLRMRMYLLNSKIKFRQLSK